MIKCSFAERSVKYSYTSYLYMYMCSVVRAKVLLLPNQGNLVVLGSLELSSIGYLY